MSDLLTPSQAAERMGITVKTIYQYLNKGQLEGAFKDERGRWQIPENAIPAQGETVPPPVEKQPEDVPDRTPSAAQPEASAPIDPTESKAEEAAGAPDGDDAGADMNEPSEEQASEPSAPDPLAPEVRAAMRERERAAALAVLYAPQDADNEDTDVSQEEAHDDQSDAPAVASPELDERESIEREAEMEGLYARDDVSGEQGEEPTPVQEDEVDQSDLSDEVASAAMRSSQQPEPENVSRESAETVAPNADVQAEAEVELESMSESQAPQAETIDVDTDASMQPDDYVMDFEPVAQEDEQTVAHVARAVEITTDEADISDVDLGAVDLAKVAAKNETETSEEGEDALATQTAKRTRIGCPVLIAIAATIIVLLIAGAFIVNQSLGIINPSAQEAPEVATPMVIAPSDAAAPSEQGASEDEASRAGEVVTGEVAPAVEGTLTESEASSADEASAGSEGATVAAEPVAEAAAAIQPKSEGETLLIVPAIAGGDASMNAALRDEIAAQASALGLGNLRVEAESASVPGDQLAQAVDLGAQYLADLVMWGEERGDGAVINLLSLQSAGLPAAEISAADSMSAERVQPLNPDAFASFSVNDVAAQLPFLAGVAVGESSILRGNYDTAATALENAVQSLDPTTPPPAGVDEALFRLGWLYQTKQGDLQSAMDAYTQALQLNLDHVSALNNIATVFDDLGDRQQALFYYNQALPLLREAENVLAEIQVLNRIGTLYNEIGDVQQALSFYNRALPLTLEAGDVEAEALTRRKIALIHKDLGDLDIAVEEMAKVVAIAETAGLPSLEQDQQALEEIQALDAAQTPETPLFRPRNR